MSLKVSSSWTVLPYRIQPAQQSQWNLVLNVETLKTQWGHSLCRKHDEVTQKITIQNQCYLPRFSRTQFQLASSVFCRQFHGTQFSGPLPVLPLGFALQLLLQPVAGARLWRLVTVYSNYGLVALHSNMTINIFFSVCGNSDSEFDHCTLNSIHYGLVSY